MGNQCTCCTSTTTGELKSEEPVKHIELEEEDTVDVMKYPADDHRPNPDFATIIVNYQHVYTHAQHEQMKKLKAFKYTEDEPEDKRLPDIPEYYQLNDGSVYQGTWFHGLPHGKGRFYCKDHTYEGYIRDAGYHGLGRMLVNNGDIYEGRFIEGLFEGKGKITYYSGLELMGNFKNGVLEGEGRELWPNMTSYSGNYKNGKKDGKGKLTYGVKINKKKKKKKRLEEGEEDEDDPNEIVYVEEFYEGDFKNNEQEGIGVYQWVDGRKYEGEWRKGKMHGQGTFLWRDGKRYQGQYKNDMKSGYGIFKWDDLRSWEGNWKNGKREGKGKFIKDGVPREGIWQNGKVVTWIDKSQHGHNNADGNEDGMDEGDFGNQDQMKSPISGQSSKNYKQNIKSPASEEQQARSGNLLMQSPDFNNIEIRPHQDGKQDLPSVHNSKIASQHQSVHDSNHGSKPNSRIPSRKASQKSNHDLMQFSDHEKQSPPNNENPEHPSVDNSKIASKQPSIHNSNNPSKVNSPIQSRKASIRSVNDKQNPAKSENPALKKKASEIKPKYDDIENDILGEHEQIKF